MVPPGRLRQSCRTSEPLPLVTSGAAVRSELEVGGGERRGAEIEQLDPHLIADPIAALEYLAAAAPGEPVVQSRISTLDISSGQT